MRAFRHSVHGRALQSMGFERDLAYAARIDVSDTVPMLFVEDGVKTLRLRGHRARRTARA
jgi:phosphosulfolactate phosphohydrolase-like enzyme